MFAITVETVFAASHAIRLADGSLEPLHGHNWRVVACVVSRQLDAIDTVMDFHLLKATLDEIIEPYRNGHLNDLPPFGDGSGALRVNPTAERLAEHIATALAAKLPAGAAVREVRVEEAADCWAICQPLPPDDAAAPHLL